MESLIAVRRDVVDPAVDAVFSIGEVTSVELSEVGDGGTVVMSLVALGETFTDRLVQAGIPGSVESWRERLRSNLVDFVAESHFGWGQNRENGPPT